MSGAWLDRLKARSTERPWAHRGYLPHLLLRGETQHIIFRLADSLPAKFQPRDGLDHILDAGHGARLLGDPRIASLVEQTLRFFEADRYLLDAWCIMPNHVHVVARFATPAAMATSVRSWKSFSARRANALLGRSGAFWARDYFDRAARSDEDARGMITYVEHNPVAAGLSRTRSQWPYSSARHRQETAGPPRL